MFSFVLMFGFHPPKKKIYLKIWNSTCPCLDSLLLCCLSWICIFMVNFVYLHRKDYGTIRVIFNILFNFLCVCRDLNVRFWNPFEFYDYVMRLFGICSLSSDTQPECRKIWLTVWLDIMIGKLHFIDFLKISNGIVNVNGFNFLHLY